MTDTGPADAVPVDIVVIGGGIAGSAAALRAAQAGARVLVLEESENQLGAGNSLMTSGSFNAAGVSPLTPPDELYGRAMAEGRANPALARAWARTCAPPGSASNPTTPGTTGSAPAPRSPVPRPTSAASVPP